MNETLATFMKIAITTVIISVLIISICYESLKETNKDYHQKVDQFQIQEK